MKNHAAIPVSTIPSSEPTRKARRTVVLRAGAGASCSPDGAELRAASSWRLLRIGRSGRGFVTIGRGRTHAVDSADLDEAVSTASRPLPRP